MMITIDDIIKRSRYINLSIENQEYKRYHTKVKMIKESKVYHFSDKKFQLQHWECLNENQVECFKYIIDILDEAYAQDNRRDFEYVKSYIINEAVPTVRDAKQTARYLKYKTTRMKNKINEKIRKSTEALKDTTKAAVDNVKDTASQSMSILNKKPVPQDKEKDTSQDDNKNVTQQDIHEAYIQILDLLEKYNQCDRVLENTNNITKRFNIMNMVENTDISNDHSLLALVDSICECVNTYDASFSTRFNTSLETCFYFLSRKDKKFNKPLVLEEIVNVFTSKELENSNLLEMKSIIESTVVFDTIDKNNIDWVYNSIPFEEVTELAKPFINSKYKSVQKIGEVLESVSNDLSDKDIIKVFSSIRETSDEQLSTCIKDIEVAVNKMASLYSGNDFGSLCGKEAKKFNNIDQLSESQYKYIQCLNKYGSKYDISESSFVMDFDLYNEAFSTISKNVKDIVNDFKVAKIKKTTDVRTCVSKIFTKSPDQIIDGTPNFLSWVRLSYVIGAVSINPILGGITLLIDQFIAMKLKRRDISKMITVFKNERKNVKEKLKRSVDSTDMKNLKEYDRYLEKGISRLQDYSDSLLSEKELDAKETGEEYDGDSELDFLSDDEDDVEMESVSFEKLFTRSNNFSKEYFTTNIKNYISIMEEDTIDIITDVARKYPSIISNNGLYSILKEESDNIKSSNIYNKRWVRLSCLESNIRKISPENEDYIITDTNTDTDVFQVINGLEDLFAEYSISKTVSPKNESLSINVKMLTNKLRNMVQKASDIDKEASKRIDSAVNVFLSGIQRATRNENREAIIKGSILPSASKIVKAAIIDGGVALVNPALAIIMALGQLALSKKMKTKERQFVLDEIDVELEMSKRYLRQAEDQNDLESQKRILRIQRNLERQKQRIQYNMKIHWKQDVPNVVSDD